MTLEITYEDDNKSTPNDGPREEITLPHKDTSAKEKAWEAAKTPKTEAPITREDITEGAPKEKSAALPDRALVAPELKKFLAERAEPEENPVVVQAQRIEQALNQIQQPAGDPPTFEEQMLAKLEALEQRELERQQREAEANAQAEYTRKMDEFKTSIVSNIEARKEDFPAIVALGKTEAVAAQLIEAMENGAGVESEEDLIKDIEQGFWEIYSRLETARKPSKATTKPSTQPETQAGSRLQTQHTQDDFDIHQYSNKKQAQEALWEKIKERHA